MNTIICNAKVFFTRGGGDGVLNKTLYGEALNNIPFLTENVPFSYTIY